jgi:hypothetical protein
MFRTAEAWGLLGYPNEYIQVVDATSLARLKQIPVNGYPAGLAVTPSDLSSLCATPPGASAAKTITAPLSRTPKPSFRFLAAAIYRVYFIT